MVYCGHIDASISVCWKPNPVLRGCGRHWQVGVASGGPAFPFLPLWMDGWIDRDGVQLQLGV